MTARADQWKDAGVRPPIVITHQSGVRFSAQVRSHQIVTDQPEHAGGTNSGPSPVELLGASLGSCIAYYVQQFCRARALPFQGMRVEVDQHGEKHPARVAEFAVRVLMPDDFPEHQVWMLERVTKSCPAHHTLSHGARMSVDILVAAGVA
ncbi:MAG TPA: OsmC family protein [Rhodothermia bacterium]|nr:OsmC family protein [Rhodothermia bacterium]